MKKQINIDTFQKYTVILGGTFLLTSFLIAIYGTASVILHRVLQDPVITPGRTLVMFAVMALASILPSVIAYFIGTLASGKKAALMTRRFNGIVLAIAAPLITGLIMELSGIWRIVVPKIPMIPIQITQFWPTFLTIAIIMSLGIMYARSSKKQSIATYRPLVFALPVVIAGWIIADIHTQTNLFTLVSTYTSHKPTDGALPATLRALTVTLMFVAVFLALYARQASLTTKVNIASIATLIGFTILAAIDTIAAHMLHALQFSLIANTTVCGIGLTFWLLYLYLTRVLHRQ